LARRAPRRRPCVMANLPCRPGGRLYDPPPNFSASTAPFGSPGAGLSLFDQAKIQHPHLGPPSQVIWPGRERLAAEPMARATRLERGPSNGFCRAAARRPRPGRLRQCLRLPALPAGRADSELLTPAQPGRSAWQWRLCQPERTPDRPAGHWWEQSMPRACERLRPACLPRCPHGLAIPDLPRPTGTHGPAGGTTAGAGSG